MAATKTETEKQKKKERQKPGARQKFDYTGEAFLSALEDMARQGFCDASIAYGLATKFDGARLDPTYFNKLKNEKDKSGKPTRRGLAISQALSRGRVDVNAAVRATYLQMALGQRTVKTTVKQRIRTKDGELTDDELVTTTEQEIAPNMQALATWLYNHDADWRENVIARKQEERDAAMAESESGPTEVSIDITYNQKSDIELQEKLTKPKE